jgi:chromosome segregation ATPase
MAKHRGPSPKVSSTSNLECASENVVNFQYMPRSSADDGGQTALSLVFQAAELIRDTKDRAYAIEQRAQSLAENAITHLTDAQDRIQQLQSERAVLEARFKEVNLRWSEAEEALKKALLRMSTAETRLLEAEKRTDRAERRANEMASAVERIEDAIRTQILGSKAQAYAKVA